jgi:hypothetical protein
MHAEWQGATASVFPPFAGPEHYSIKLSTKCLDITQEPE